jgi:hypothetical protein
MKVISIIENQFTIFFTKEEISVLCKALNVVCDEIDEWEFQIRLGIHLKDAKILLETLTTALKKMPDADDCEADILKTYKEPTNLKFQDPSLNQFAQIGDEEWLICPLCIDPWISRDTLDVLAQCPKCRTIFRNPRFLDSR